MPLSLYIHKRIICTHTHAHTHIIPKVACVWCRVFHILFNLRRIIHISNIVFFLTQSYLENDIICRVGRRGIQRGILYEDFVYYHSDEIKSSIGLKKNMYLKWINHRFQLIKTGPTCDNRWRPLNECTHHVYLSKYHMYFALPTDDFPIRNVHCGFFPHDLSFQSF